MKILVVEDENALREVIVRSLEKERYVVESASSFREASLKINDYDYDCIVLDIMLPGGSGLSLLEELKKMRKKDSVIIVSAKDSIEDKVTGLDLGADDYLTKPFSVEELLARIRTTLRRLSYAQTGGVVSEGSFDTGELHIDFDAGIATMDGEELHLTPIEYKLLCLLAHNADKVLTHQFILHEIWGTATKSDLASLRVFMGTLRKKIESDPAHPRYIQTHVGIGYRLVIQG